MGQLSREKLYEIEKLNNFKELVDRSAKLYPNKVAFIYKLNPKDTTYITHTYAQFKSDIESLGSSLLARGLAGKRTVIIAPNRYEWCVSYFAVTTAGMIVVPLDKSLPDNEIENSVIRSEAEAVIYDQKYDSVFSKLKEEKSSKLKQYICMDDLDGKEESSYSYLIQEGKKLLEEGNTRLFRCSN